MVMRLCSPVVLSYLDAGFEPRCGRKDFLTASPRLQLGPSWVLVLLNELEITVEESPLASKMFLRGQYDRPETGLKSGLFSPRNRPPCGTTAWHTPYSPPICILLMAQSLWKNNGPHWKHLRGRPTIVLSFHDDRLAKTRTRTELGPSLA